MSLKDKKSLSAVLDGLRSPFVCGGHRYYDNLLNKLHLNENPEKPFTPELNLIKTWDVFRQTFIDECFNRGSSKKWTAVPFLDIVDSPCAAGSVILCTNRELKQRLLRQPKPAFFAGLASDFYPQGRTYMMMPMVPKTMPLHWRNYFRVYQSRHSEKAVMISLTVEDKSEINDELRPTNVLLDLDNFEDTGFQHKYCYVVTKVITARSLKIEVTDDGEVFHEAEYTAAVPICFQASKVHLYKESCGLLSKIEPVTKVLDLNYRRRRNWQNFLNAFIPNQNRLGHSSGDYPNSMSSRRFTVLKSYRPQILPRKNRRKNDCVWYFDSVSELRSLRYNFRRDRKLNRNALSEQELINLDREEHKDEDESEDDEDSIDEDADNDVEHDIDENEDDDNDEDDEEDPYAYYPPPNRKAVEYEDFEW